MTINSLCRTFTNHSVCVVGMKGSGKDLLLGNVVARRKKPYLSNLDYTNDSLFIPIDFNSLNLNGNTFDNIVSGRVRHYTFPYPQGTDVYISDVGIYFPSQYCSELNKRYPSFPFYMALSRQLSGNHVHINTQNLNRCWDKIREHSDYYILCNWCYVIFGYVIQHITIYDKYDSCVNRVKPCRVHKPLTLDKTASLMADTYLDNFYNQHGNVTSHLLIYKNKSKHDTLYFKKFFERGGSNA